MHLTRQSRPARQPRAFTVVEVLVALVVVSVGLLGIAGTSALSLRAGTSATTERRAVRRLLHRLAELSAGGCPRAVAGARGDSGDGIHERWTVAAEAHGVVMIDAAAWWREGARPRSLVLRSALQC